MTTALNRRAADVPDIAPSTLAGAFNRQWREDYESRPTPPAWASDASLAGYRRMGEVLVELKDKTEPDRAAAILTSLMERAAAGDAEAVQVVVQLLMPCLVRVAFLSWGPPYRRASEALDELVTTAWEVARGGVSLRGRNPKLALLRSIEYRALRRPVRVARARREVLLATGEDRELSKSAYRPHRSADLVADLSGRPLSATTNAGEEVVRVLAAATADGASRDDVQLVGALSVGGLTCAEVGAAVGVTDRGVRKRRTAAVRRLSEWAA